MMDQFTPQEHAEDKELDEITQTLNEATAELKKGKEGDRKKILRALGLIMNVGQPIEKQNELRAKIYNLVESQLKEIVEECNALGCSDPAVAAIIDTAGWLVGVQSTELRDQMMDSFNARKMDGLRRRHEEIAKGNIK